MLLATCAPNAELPSLRVTMKLPIERHHHPGQWHSLLIIRLWRRVPQHEHDCAGNKKWKNQSFFNERVLWNLSYVWSSLSDRSPFNGRTCTPDGSLRGREFYKYNFTWVSITMVLLIWERIEKGAPSLGDLELFFILESCVVSVCFGSQSVVIESPTFPLSGNIYGSWKQNLFPSPI